MAERENILFFSSSSLMGRMGNIALALLSPLGFPVLAAAIFTAMMKADMPAASVYPLFAAGIVLLYMNPGPLWAFQIGAVATLIGMIGFMLSETGVSKIMFIANAAFLWTVFYLMSRINGRYQSVRHGLNEEKERLEISVNRLSSDARRIKFGQTDIRKRIQAYHRMEAFIDELLGAYSQQELMTRAHEALTEMFPRCHVTARLFPEKNLPDPVDDWGQRALQSQQALLFTSKSSPIPTLALGRFIFIPLVLGRETIGWVGLEISRDREEDSFDIHDLRLAGIACNLISLALQNAELYAQTQALASSDSLTGLYTRGYFDERFLEEFTKAKRRDLPLSLLVLDIDHFKKVNDNHGHNLGDEILRWLARTLSGEIRETDILSRYGGDEFVILMPLTRAKEAFDFAQRLHKKIGASHFRWEGEKIKITLSGGVSGLKKNHKNVEDMFHDADQSLYVAKRNGRNQVADNG
jgi:diguanylate cyclase (GGDEF)-like protein